MTTPILQLANVESNYGPVQALRGVSLSVTEGKIVTVLGANGAGKTTTLKTISGIIEPLKGQVKFRGQDIQGNSPDAIVRGGIVHVPEGRHVLRGLSVRETEALVKAALEGREIDGPTPRAGRPVTPPDVHTRAAEERLKIHLGTRVRIVRKAKGGRIEIDFTSEDELIRIFESLTEK